MRYLHVVTGPMRAGKTSYLITVAQCKRKTGHKVLMLTSSIDTRFPGDLTGTHSDQRIECRKIDTFGVVDDSTLSDNDVIIVDEAQLFTGLRQFVERCLKLNKMVFVGGLIGDAKQRLFGEIHTVLPLADIVEHRRAFCMVCGRETAAFTISDEGLLPHPDQQVNIGCDAAYRTVCGEHLN